MYQSYVHIHAHLYTYIYAAYTCKYAYTYIDIHMHMLHVYHVSLNHMNVYINILHIHRHIHIHIQNIHVHVQYIFYIYLQISNLPTQNTNTARKNIQPSSGPNASIVVQAICLMMASKHLSVISVWQTSDTESPRVWPFKNKHEEVVTTLLCQQRKGIAICSSG